MSLIYINPYSFAGIVTDSLLLYLDAGNSTSYPGSGTTWTDLSGNGNTGTLINGPTYSSANGGSIVFDGINDLVTVNLSKATIGSNLTFSIWMLCDFPLAIDRGVFQIADALNSNGPWVLLQRPNTTTVRWYLNGNYRITNNLLDSTYVNLTITYDGTTWTVYKNGISDGTYVGNLGTLPGNSTWLGNGFNGYFGGNIAQFFVYNRALSATEITQNFNALRGRYGL